MTRYEAIREIEKTIKKYGFEPTANRFSPLPQIESELNIAVTIVEKIDFEACNIERRESAYTVEAYASVRRMGGNPTTEELLKAADEIRRGALLAEKLQGMEIAYTVGM